MFWIVACVSALCLLASLLPLISIPHGAFRVFDFPRIQILVIAALFLALGVTLLPTTPATVAALIALAISIGIQLAYIARFSPLWPRRSKDYAGADRQATTLRILVSNVKQNNRDYDSILDLVRSTSPDIAIFMETDEQWVSELETIAGEFDERVHCPQGNTYGMTMFSRLPLVEKQIRFLLNKEVPSFDCVVEHEDGQRFRLLSVHPEPPVVTGDTIGRDAEIAMVGTLVRDETMPVIVTGDLNDVAWSSTTRRFLRVSRLLDPREGRGLFNTFDARHFLFRWPLDHIFHSPHFEVIAIKRQSFVGSDHFPMLYDLALLADGNAEREMDAAEPQDIEQADELIAIEKNRDRRPAGHDWEDPPE